MHKAEFDYQVVFGRIRKCRPYTNLYSLDSHHSREISTVNYPQSKLEFLKTYTSTDDKLVHLPGSH
jgi:hypothetical protein